MRLKLRAESRITLASHWQGLCWLALSACLLPGKALADPCDLVTERGPMPAEVRSGNAFSGLVSYVENGEALPAYG